MLSLTFFAFPTFQRVLSTRTPSREERIFNVYELIAVQSLISSYRHFSHVTKSRIFKNLNLRRKADRKFRSNLLKNHFRHLKLYSNPPIWLARSRCHMSAFRKTKGWSSHFWEGQPFRFCYVGVHRQRRLKSTKTGIFTSFKTLARPETKNLVYFL